MPLSREKKEAYFAKLKKFMSEFNKCFLVSVDNVASKQMAQIRYATRNNGSSPAEVLMGKNTMMRKIIKEFIDENPGHGFSKILPLIRGNVGFVFTNGDLAEVKGILEENRVPAPARAGSIAPVKVVVPAGPTGCDPGQTSFFQALQIATKIAKGQIEILNDVPLVDIGEKVGASEAALLQKLDIRPFTYGLVIETVYDDGALFSPKVLDMTDEILIAKFAGTVQKVASVGMVLEQTSLATLPHYMAHAFNNLVAVAIECVDVSFDEAKPFKDAVGVKPEKKEEPKEEAAEAPAPAPAAAADY